MSLFIKLEPTDSILEEIYCKSILEENIGFIGRYLRFSPEKRREWEEGSYPLIRSLGGVLKLLCYLNV